MIDISHKLWSMEPVMNKIRYESYLGKATALDIGDGRAIVTVPCRADKVMLEANWHNALRHALGAQYLTISVEVAGKGEHLRETTEPGSYRPSS